VRLAALLLAALGAVALVVPALPLAPATAASALGAAPALRADPPATGVTTLERRLADRINQARDRRGCRGLRHRQGLQGAAREHSALMARHRRMAHQLPGEPSLEKRLAAAGYRGSRRMGEVIAAGPMSPKRTLRMWLSSPGHRRLLLDCGFRRMGVGIVDDGAGGRWWTVDLVR